MNKKVKEVVNKLEERKQIGWTAIIELSQNDIASRGFLLTEEEFRKELRQSLYDSEGTTSSYILEVDPWYEEEN